MSSSSDRRPVHLGVIGCGGVFLFSYGPHLQRLEARGDARVTFVCDVNEAALERVRSRFPESSFTTTADDVFGSSDVDAVLVLTHPGLHGAMTLDALEGGKHVLVEKPMAPTLSEASTIVDRANERSLHVVCAPHVILSGTYKVMWKRIHGGEIGKPTLARARYGEAGTIGTPWRYADTSGGGALYDLGVYNITSLTGFFGPASRVTAMGGMAIAEHVMPRTGERVVATLPDSIQVLIEFATGVNAAVTTGFTMPEYRSPAIEVYGTDGVIQMLGDDWAPEGYELWLTKDAEPDNLSGPWLTFPNVDPFGHEAWKWTAGIEHLVNCIIEGTRPLSTPEHAYHVLEVMLKADEAMADGVTRSIGSTFPPLAYDPDEIDVTVGYPHATSSEAPWLR